MAAAASWAVEVQAMGAVDLVPMLQIEPAREVGVAVEVVVRWLRVVSWAGVLLARAPDLVDPAVAAAAIRWGRWATPWPVVAVEPVEAAEAVAAPVAEVAAEATVEATAGHLAVEVAAGHLAVVLAVPAAQVAVGPVTRVAQATAVVAVEAVEAVEHVATAAEATAKAVGEVVRAVEAAARAVAIAVAVVAVTHVVVCHVGALAVSHVVKHLAAPPAAMPAAMPAATPAATPAAEPEVVCHATVVQQLDAMVGRHATTWTPQTFEAAAVAGVARLPCVAEHPVDAVTSPAAAVAAQLAVGKLRPAETVLGTAAVATSIRSNSHWWGSCLYSKACPLECRWL